MGYTLCKLTDRVIEECVYGAKRPEFEAIARKRRIGLRHVLAETLVEALSREFVVLPRSTVPQALQSTWIGRFIAVLRRPWTQETLATFPSDYPIHPSVEGYGVAWISKNRIVEFERKQGYQEKQTPWDVCEMIRNELEQYDEEFWPQELLVEAEIAKTSRSEFLANRITASLFWRFDVTQKNETEGIPF
jgi:hypothetical protein